MQERTHYMDVQNTGEPSYMRSHTGLNMHHMLNGMVTARAVIIVDPLVRHSTCHSQAIKNPGEQGLAI